MTQLTTVAPVGFGVTSRRDAWWVGPVAVLAGLLVFFVYANIASLQGTNFEIRKDKDGRVDWQNGDVVAPYLTPFYSPLLYDARSPHAWFHQATPAFWPGWFPFSAAMLILPFPGLFRLTCYYYRKAYYRAILADPPACAVGEMRKSYWGENRLPLILQNCHRYALYFALLFLVFLLYDALVAFWWPTDSSGKLLPNHAHQFGMGLGTLILLANWALLTSFTFGCNSLRHLVGGRFDCFSCPHNIAETRKGYRAWRFVSWFNERHQLWAWLSLFSVGFSDFYIRMCSMGVWTDLRFF
jgi:hypothetical protein